jgi:PIN domain nuclease of toxin-antitoxin system
MERDALIYLDTHVLVRLYAGETSELGPAARSAIQANSLMASPAAVLELEFLHEIKRLQVSASTIMDGLRRDLGVSVCDLPFAAVVAQALHENWGRDPFDRLIVANAKARGAGLVTKDHRIRKYFSEAIW